MIGSDPTDTVITPDQATTIQHFAVQQQDLLAWVITENPSDFPGKFIARPLSLRRGGRSYLCHLEADTLDDIRNALPPGLAMIDRDRSDDPVIVETWI